MPWTRLKNVEGRIYEPPARPLGNRKHHCPDCLFCQMCSDSRCSECLNRKACLARRKSSAGGRRSHRRKITPDVTP